MTINKKHRNGAAKAAPLEVAIAQSRPSHKAGHCTKSAIAQGRLSHKARYRTLTTSHRPLHLHKRFGGDALDDEDLDHVPDFDIAVVRNRNAAFHAGANFADIFLEAPH